VAINEQADLFITTRSNLKTPSQAFVFQITEQARGVDGLAVKQLAQLTGNSPRRYLKIAQLL